METSIGVKDISASPLVKRDLLLFDQIAVPQLDINLTSGEVHSSVIAELEWLIDNGLLINVPVGEFLKVGSEADPHSFAILQGYALLDDDVVRESAGAKEVDRFIDEISDRF